MRWLWKFNGAVALAGLVGCGGGGASLGEPTGPAPLDGIRVLPSELSLSVGQTSQLLVSAVDQTGATVTGGVWSFKSADPAVATVSTAGMVTAVAAGQTAVVVAFSWNEIEKQAQAVVRVAAPPPPGSPNEVTTPGTSFLPANLTIPLGDSVAWVFSGAIHNVTFNGPAPAGGNIADQNAGARVTRVFSTAGTYDYECTRHAGMTGQVVVQGSAPATFTTLTVTPTSPSLEVGATVQLTATPRDQNGSPMSGLPAPSFQSSATNIATVSPAGLVTAVAAGMATITATLTAGGVTKTATATVTVSAPVPGAVTVTTPSNTFSPSTVTIPTGGTVAWQFSGTVHNVTFNGAAPTGGNIPDQAVGNTVSRTFGTAGTYDYECTRHAGMTGQVIVQGSAPTTFTTLTVTPTSPSLEVGATVQLTATPRDQNGSPMSGLPTPSFQSSAASVATVSPTGLVTAVAAGTATITVTLTAGGVTKTATATVTVSAPVPGAVTVTTPSNTFSPSTVTIPTGGTVTWQFSGTVHNVTFNGAAPTGGNIPDQAVGNTVSRTFGTAGTYDYECTRHAGMTGQVVVQGSAPTTFTTLTVTPTSPSLVVGATVQLTATPRDQNGSPMSGLPAPSFQSSAASVATVSPTGLVTAVAAGTATITATLTTAGVTKTATATVTVSAPVPGAVTVTTPGNSFSPRAVTIPVGGTVTWQFSGGTHNVTFNGGGPSGGNIPDQSAGNSVSRTFPAAGTFNYECTRHGGMTGQVTVQGGGGGTPGILAAVQLAFLSTVLAANGTADINATGVDETGQPVTGPVSASYASDAPAVATVSTTGTIRGVAAGTATITVTLSSGGISKSATVAVQVVSGAVVNVTTTATRFSPEEVEVAAGTTVVWRFEGATHNVTFKDTPPAGGNIGDTASGNAVARTFSVSRTYDYECTIHKGMKGRIRVR